jgi:hypothetical protein
LVDERLNDLVCTASLVRVKGLPFARINTLFVPSWRKFASIQQLNDVFWSQITNLLLLAMEVNLHISETDDLKQCLDFLW